jgi:hypothetical protein
VGFPRSEHNEMQEWWTTAPGLDEDSLRAGVLGLLHKIHDAKACDDWALVEDYIRLYELGETYCREEPHLSIYEYGSLGIGCTVACNHLNMYEYAEAAAKLSEVFKRYAARMERYSRRGLPPRRASEAKNYALLLLCDLKWIAPEEYRDFLLTPDMLLVEQRVTIEHMFRFMKENPDPRRNDRNLLEGMALAALGSCKVALRYSPQRLAETVRFFNSTFAQHLALQPYHYRETAAAGGDNSAYYWDFEISKLRMEDDPPLQDLYMCIELRSLAARNTFGDWKIQGLLRGWRRESLAIIRELKERSANDSSREIVAQAAG